MGVVCEVCGKDSKMAGHIMTECLASHRFKGRQTHGDVMPIDNLFNQTHRRILPLDSLCIDDVKQIDNLPQIKLSDFRKLSVVKIKALGRFQIVADDAVILDCYVVEPRVGGGVVAIIEWGKTKHGN